MSSSPPVFRCSECHGVFTAKELEQHTLLTMREHSDESFFASVFPFSELYYETDAFYICPRCNHQHVLEENIHDAMQSIIFHGFQTPNNNLKARHLLKGEYHQ